MASSALKPLVNKGIAPIARFLLAIGLTPNAVTIIGAIGSITSASYFYAQGDLVVGSLLVTFFTLSDLFDGAMARMSDRGASTWGGFLDSTLDRLTDAAILAGMIIYFVRSDDRLAYLAIVALILGFLIPYIRAKAESFDINCSVGVAERTERLILAVAGIGLSGLGVPYIAAVSLWSLVALSAVTVVQRIVVIHKGLALS